MRSMKSTHPAWWCGIIAVRPGKDFLTVWMMNETLGWQGMIQMSSRLLKERIREDVETWKQRIEKELFQNEQQL
jgi:hypothetical protein